MKILTRLTHSLLISTSFAISATSAASAQASFGVAQKFNDGWKFCLTDSTIPTLTESAHWTGPEYADSLWRTVTVPHDWSIELLPAPTLNSCTGYYPGGIGWYRKTFTMPENPAEKQYILFEGVYNRSEVYLNGHLLGKRPNGYVSFAYDMTPYLRPPGEQNVLAVRVDTHAKPIRVGIQAQVFIAMYTSSKLTKPISTFGALAGVPIISLPNRQISLSISTRQMKTPFKANCQQP